MKNLDFIDDILPETETTDSNIEEATKKDWEDFWYNEET